MLDHPTAVVSIIALAALALVACYPVYYIIGLAVSRGYHRGKQEHLDLIMRQCTTEEPTSGTRQRS
jgi:hypothetical protein